MVSADGHVKITDFGIARMASSAVRTQTGMVLGSPKYMSPEQVMGKAIDHRSDIFSLGVMLYEMLTGQAPFMGENVNAIMYQTLNAIPPAPGTINPGVPDMLNFIVAKALAKSLESRYQSAKEMAEDLRACREAMPRSKTTLSGGEKKSAPAPSAVQEQQDAEEDGGDEGESPISMRLSSSFDSAGATMRLAAMTASQEEVEDLAKTFKMARPSLNEINRAAPQPQVFSRSASPVRPPEPKADKGGGLILLGLVVLIVLGLLFAFLK